MQMREQERILLKCEFIFRILSRKWIEMYDFDDSLIIWVSDLDNWINVDFSAEHEAETEALEAELDHKAETHEDELGHIGKISLFAQRSISSQTIQARGINAGEWRWSLHEAEKALGDASDRHEIERFFVKKLIDMGRSYAVRRYARWEKLPYSSALTATFSHGIRALVYQYIAGEQSLRDLPNRQSVQGALHAAIKAEGLTAYDRTGIIQQALHHNARLVNGAEGHCTLDKIRTKTILSLCRLHFSVRESNLSSLEELQELDRLYNDARTAMDNGMTLDQEIVGRRIRNWKMRHLHPLIFLFPYSVRNAITRGYYQVCDDPNSFDRNGAVNELALAHCGIELMRKRSIDRQLSQ